MELLDAVGSTNAHAAATPTPWHLVAAHAQDEGRGRMSRSWQVPPGAAVTCSMTVPLPSDPAQWGWVPLYVGEATRRAVLALAGHDDVDVALKWPNDVLARRSTSSPDEPDMPGTTHAQGARGARRARSAPGEHHADTKGGGAREDVYRKIAGILCQVVTGKAPLVVVGVGLNVTQGVDELPVETASSLALCGLEVTRDDALVALAREVRRVALAWESDAVALRRAVRAHCASIGREVELHTPDGDVMRRHVLGIDDEGRLDTVLPGERADSPNRMAFSVADVVHARRPGS